jgi:hypothetical protein
LLSNSIGTRTAAISIRVATSQLRIYATRIILMSARSAKAGEGGRRRPP